MAALSIGLAAAILGTLAHAIVLRHLAERLIFLSIPMLLLAALAVVVAAYAALVGTVGPMAVVLALTLSMSLGLCYALTLIGIVHDSPTLALANTIIDADPKGMAVSDLPGFVQSHPFVSSRVAVLMAGGELTIEGDHIVRPTSLSSVVLRVGEAHRLLRGAGPTAE